MWVESQWGKVRCLCSYSEAVEPGTVWTWNAIGKAPGAWRLAPDANESQRGFLLNHLISEELPGGAGGARSPTRTRSPGRRRGTTSACGSIKAEAGEPEATWPQFAPVPAGARDRARNAALAGVLRGPRGRK